MREGREMWIARAAVRTRVRREESKETATKSDIIDNCCAFTLILVC